MKKIGPNLLKALSTSSIADAAGIFPNDFIAPQFQGCNELLIVTPEASSALLVDLAVLLAKKRRLVYAIKSETSPPLFPLKLVTVLNPSSTAGMIQLKSLKCLASRYPNLFSIRLLPNEVLPNDSVYLWKILGTSMVCWKGTTGFTYRGFQSPDGSLTETDSKIGGKDAEMFFCSAVPAESAVIPDPLLSSEGLSQLRISWLNKYNTVSMRSGPNWGKRLEYQRRQNEAYIPLRSAQVKAGFFPSRGQYFTFITKDGETFIGVTAQDNSKAIETPLDNSAIGLYLRRKLNLPSGAEVKTIHFNQYGSSSILFTKIDEETYVMDF